LRVDSAVEPSSSFSVKCTTARCCSVRI
jgi:hypothetical protein